MSRRRTKRNKRRIGDFVVESMELNTMRYNDYLNQLMEIALNVYSYENLPDTIDPRYIELCLMQNGNVCFFQDEYIGHLCLPCTASGMFNVNNVPTEYHIFAPNGYNATRNITNSVLIYNNYLRTPSLDTIKLYAYSLANCRRSMDINIGNQKFPYIIKATESQRLSVENAFMQIDGNCPAILVDRDFNPDSIQPMEVAVPFVADKLHVEFHNIWNDFLTWCGIENSNQDKKERLVADEVGSNYGNVEVSRNVRLNTRQYGFDRVNKMFGTNIKVSYNSNLRTMLNEYNLGVDVLKLANGGNSITSAKDGDNLE